MGNLASCDGNLAQLEPELPPVEDSEALKNLVDTTFSASLPEDVVWKVDDKVAIYDGVAKREFAVAEVDDSGLAVLNGYVAAGAEEIHAVWPYESASETLPEEGKVIVNVPAVQTVGEEGNSDPAATVCVGKLTDGRIAFEKAISHVKVSIPDGVTSVSVKGLAYENVSGNTASVVLNPAGETFKAGEYSIAVFPQSFRIGYKVVYAKDGYLAVAKIVPAQDSEMVLEAGKSYDITGQTAGETLVWLADPIMTEAQLMEYMKNQEAYVSEVARIGADITLASAWTPVELTGTLDGQGHVISGLSVSAGADAGMFSSLAADATLKNITVEGSVTLAAEHHPAQAGLVANLYGTMYKVVSRVAVTAASEKGACYMGGLVGQLSDGSLIECRNEGNLTLQQTVGKGYVGGAVGVVYPAGLVDKCVNTGAIITESGNTDGLGGMVGLQQGGDVKGCVNEGKIVVNAGYSSCKVGGVVGTLYNYTSKVAKVSQCINKGEFEINAPSMKAVGGVVGGIVDGGGDVPSSVEVDGCENHASISMSVAKTAGNSGLDGFYLGGIVGCIDAMNESLIVNTVRNSKNTGNIYASLSPDAGANNAIKVGGICGNTRGPVAVEGNENASTSVILENPDAAKLLCAVGGIIGEVGDPWSSEETSLTLVGNTNRASVLSKTNNIETPAGGLIGYLFGPVASGGNRNFGDVERAVTDNQNLGKFDSCFAGGFVGLISLGSEHRFPAYFNADMTMGTIKSVGRAGIFMGGLRSSSKGDMKFQNCVVGGRLISPVPNDYDIVMTEDNWDDKNSEADGGYLWSYAGKRGNYGLNIDGVKYGDASAYDQTYAKDVKCAFMGDSITDNWDDATKGHPSFFTDNSFLNAGVSGQTTSQMLSRFSIDVVQFKPKAVVICAGTNDIAQNQGYISNEDIMKNIAAMCDKAEEAGIKVILCSLLPANRYTWRPEVKPAALIKDLNARIQAYCTEKGYPYVDYWTPLADTSDGLPAEHSSDGVHPNQSCYTLMEGIILPVIQSVL